MKKTTSRPLPHYLHQAVSAPVLLNQVRQVFEQIPDPRRYGQHFSFVPFRDLLPLIPFVQQSRANMTDPRPPWALQQLTRTRRRVETVIGPLTAQFHWKKIWARDIWHLTSRIARKVLAHTLGIFINRQVGRSDLQFEGLIT